MKLQVKRTTLTDKSTIGELSIDGSFFCYTLEDTVRAKKIPGETAIPTGTYKMSITWSPRFQKMLPELHNVPGFEGIRIHTGNYPRDTEGCLLLGFQKGADCIMASKAAFDELMKRLHGQPDVTISIS